MEAFIWRHFVVICSIYISYVELVLTGYEESNITNHLLKNYDKTMIPIDEDRQPINVHVLITITGMEPVDNKNNHGMSYSFNMYFRMLWRDYRLSSRKLQKDLFNISQPRQMFKLSEFIDNLWTPDVYFAQGDSVILQTITTPNKMVRLGADGDVSYSQRLFVEKAHCNMDLHHFPFDEQKCIFNIESYAYTEKFLKLFWLNSTLEPPVVRSRTANEKDLTEYLLTKITWGRSIINYPIFGNNSVLNMAFYFTRQSSYYIWQMYIPCILIVMLSWVSFWIDYKSTPARVGLGITTVLTLATLGNSIRSSLPKVSYSKSIDWYVLVCFIYVFLALLEFALVGITDLKWRNFFLKEEKTVAGEIKKSGQSSNRSSKEFDCDNLKKLSTTRSLVKNISQRRGVASESSINGVALEQLQQLDEKYKRQRSGLTGVKRKVTLTMMEKHNKAGIHIIDKISRYAFPISFGIINMVYFTYLTYVKDPDSS